MRIAYLIDTINSNKAGTEKQLLSLIERLDNEIFDVTIICLYESKWMQETKLPCKVISLTYSGFLKANFPSVMLRYLSILKEQSFDIVQTFFEDSFFVAYLGKLISRHKHSLIASRRDLGLGIDEPRYHRIFKQMRPFALKSVNGIATNAEAIKTFIIQQEKIPAEKIRVIGNGIEFPERPKEIPLLFSENKSALWIGLVANLKPVKRIDVFLRALAHLKFNCNFNGFSAAILGQGRLQTEMMQLAEDLGIAEQVHFVGSVGNVSDYLQYIDIGVLCSDNEGLPNAIMEYMACGLPVVATDAGGVDELVDTTNGICVPAGNYEALGDALYKLVSSPELRKKMGKHSIEKIKINSTWNIIVPQWENYYRSMARIEI